ncbi:6663_t:CDS:2, partial [Scutellospora calospora]
MEVKIIRRLRKIKQKRNWKNVLTVNVGNTQYGKEGLVMNLTRAVKKGSHRHVDLLGTYAIRFRLTSQKLPLAFLDLLYESLNRAGVTSDILRYISTNREIYREYQHW